jgi:hypothetical protein
VIVDELEVVWAYRPDDRSKQGKSERLPADLARMKVAEGLAVWPKPKPEPAEVEAPKASTAKVPKQHTSNS